MRFESIFVTGGAGYVGAVLVPRLLDEGYRVTVLDLMIYGEDLLPENSRLRVIKGDIRDQRLLRSGLYLDRGYSFTGADFARVFYRCRSLL